MSDDHFGWPALNQLPPSAHFRRRSSISPLRREALYLLWRLGQCTWVLKVSVLETGHTRYCSVSGSDPLRQSYRLCHGYCRKTPTTNQPTNQPTNQRISVPFQHYNAVAFRDSFQEGSRLTDWSFNGGVVLLGSILWISKDHLYLRQKIIIIIQT